MDHHHQHVHHPAPAASGRAAPAPRQPGQAAPPRYPRPPRPALILGDPRHRQLPAAASRTCWYGCPPTAENTVHAAPRAPSTSPSAAPSAAASSSPPAAPPPRCRLRRPPAGDEPRPLLGERHRHPPRRGRAQRRGPGPPPLAGRLATRVGASNNARTPSSAPSTARTRDTSRATTSSECPPRVKGILRPNPVHPEDLGEHPAQDLLTHRGGRPAIRTDRVVRRGQRGPVYLPVRRQRQRLKHRHRRRQHVLGQPPSGEGTHIHRQLTIDRLPDAVTAAPTALSSYA